MILKLKDLFKKINVMKEKEIFFVMLFGKCLEVLFFLALYRVVLLWYVMVLVIWKILISIRIVNIFKVYDFK